MSYPICDNCGHEMSGRHGQGDTSGQCQHCGESTIPRVTLRIGGSEVTLTPKPPAEHLKSMADAMRKKPRA